MNRLRFWMFLAMCITLLVQSTAVEEEPAEHEIVCEGATMKLTCSNKSFAITIQSAIYGRDLPGSILCPKQDTDMSTSDELTCDEDVYSKVKELCEAKMNCTIPTNKETLGEPCPNVYKYLTVAYKCEDVVIRPNRQVPNLSLTPIVVFPTRTERSRISSSTVELQPTPSLVQKLEQFSTDYKRLNSSSTASPTNQHGTTSSSYTSSSYRVSVSPVSQPRHFTTTATITNLRSIPLTSSPSSKPAPKTTENKTVQTHTNMGQHGTMKLFHFILSFHIVRQEKIEKHTANSIVWFFLGLLFGLLIMSAVFLFYRVRRCRRKRKGKPDKASYLKQKEILDTDEKLELNSKKMEVLEMESQFGETV